MTKIKKKLLESFIECDTCSIRVGPQYLSREFFDIGKYKLCKSCYKTLKDRGFIELNSIGNKILLLLPDGKTIRISREKLKQLHSLKKKNMIYI